MRATWEQEVPFQLLVVRIWRTGLDQSRAPEYENFAVRISLPMFRRHAGFLGVLFTGIGAERTVITLWSDMAAVVALDASADYQATVRAIESTGFLRPPQRVELLPVHSSWIKRSVTTGRDQRMTRSITRGRDVEAPQDGGDLAGDIPRHPD